MSEGQCRLDLQCSDAHSEAELAEWRERLKLRQMKANKAAQHTKSFSDSLIEKLAAGGKVSVVSVIHSALCSRNFQNVKLRLDFVEI